jgi:2-iminobutanoate/2-iminopropanoate deaminase
VSTEKLKKLSADNDSAALLASSVFIVKLRSPSADEWKGASSSHQGKEKNDAMRETLIHEIKHENPAASLVGRNIGAQHKAIDFTKGMPFSDGYVAGNTLYVAGQQGPDSQGKVTGTDITLQTTNAIAAVEKILKKAGFQMTDITSVTVYVTDLNDVPRMNDIYKKLIPDPKPARATVQVAGLIGGAKIEISAIAVKP